MQLKLLAKLPYHLLALKDLPTFTPTAMLFKPWNEQPSPRHIIQGDSSAGLDAIPSVDINLDQTLTKVEYFVISPHNTKSLVEALPKGQKIGAIKISFPKSIVEDVTEDTFDEDEQLYTAIEEKIKANSYGTYEIDIWKNTDSITSVAVPRFKEAIVNNFLARKLVEKFSDLVQSWVILSLCEIKYGDILNRLDINDTSEKVKVYSSVPSLKPPHFISGISASLHAQLKKNPGTSLFSIVVRSEGNLGYERINVESLLEGGYVLSEIFGKDFDNKSYIGNVTNSSKALHQGYGSSMYI
ncbi:Piso0_000948 [Millerozyma farinosa CBS 7064]|uniref:Piso0_000948 protein n=1 Tax=Pichia sorbitophila (strain ATCC MYA-4447 / BCRC 22081 / CBS 7064 / NBRC 10061 / NRRL Y-12695) TaxID=559304 RepID=G8YQH8_PICSO|nr:Piso0_000948 [Millerozyma farinosa CBS 7064]